MFKDISFTACANQLVRVYGKNGSGKSSLLKIICGLLGPNQGSVSYNQKKIQIDSSNYHRNLTYIGHRCAVKPQLTIKQNISHLANMRGTSISPARRLAILDQLELTDYQNIPAAYLSAGQQRRIALSRLWFEQTHVWVLDEPYCALDTSMIEILNYRLKQALDNSVVIILTSHQDVEDFGFPVIQISLGK